MGRVEIVALLDVPLGAPIERIFPSVAAESWQPYREIYPRSWDGDQFRHNAQCYLLVTPTERILIDTGFGPGPHAMLGGATGGLLDELRAAGTAPDEIDRVVFTHLHGDHIGWNLQDGVTTFPAARYVVPQADWEHFRAGGSAPNAAVAEQVEPLEAMGVLDLVDGERTLTPELTLLPTPGHTPGHQSLVIASGGERALILGDVANHPAQVEELDWTPIFDLDAAAAIATRRRVMEGLEEGGDLLAACHFPHHGFGHVVRMEGRRVFRAL
ncbi:MAG: MBL fold metallo-hydrolase [Chloroflexi bacterium]|nr:MBL fold metallo-hydrolase [Chloroflexota bacterium]